MDKAMDYSNKINQLTKKIYYSRLRMLTNHPFFGVFALDMKYTLDSKEKTFSTNGYSIAFNPNFLDMLNDEELDICILHCILHTVLKHPFKEANYENKPMYNLACDIVVNSNILYSINSIGTKELKILGQKLPHLAPDGKEGYLYSTTEVYEMLMKKKTLKPKFKKDAILSIKTNKKGEIYAKLLSYSTYSSEGKWTDLVLLDNAFTISPNLYSYDKYISLTNLKYEAELKNLSELPILPTISYGAKYNLSKYDGIANKTKTKHEKQYFTYKKFNIDEIKKLQKINFSNQILENEELLYRDFVKKHYLTVPENLKKYFETFCKINNFSKDDKDIIEKIITYFKYNFKYNLSYLPISNGNDFIIQFMEETKEGLCQHFASAATMLFRFLNIPARYCVGYMVDATKNKEVFAYDEDLHAWVEIYFDNVGWIVVEATNQNENGYQKDKSNNSDDDKDNDNNDENDENDDDSNDVNNDKNNKSSSNGNNSKQEESYEGSIDSHGKWDENKNKEEENKDRSKEIDSKLIQANDLSTYKNAGSVPAFVPIAIENLTNPQIDWRIYLQSFIQESIIDYSFMPPDRRMSDLDFLLPSFSEPDEIIKNVLFMVDVSGSMNAKDVITCFSEIQAAITQFNGKIRGFIGFFDCFIKDVYEFDGDTELKNLKFYGGGGTDFWVVFKYIKTHMQDNLPSSIIILTDGYATFPPENVAMGIPVLWVINNKLINPPWGSVTRIKSQK